MNITVTTTIHASIEKVWSAYTTPSDIMQWNAASDDWHTTAAQVDLREGGKFCSSMEAKDKSFGFDFEGIYTLIKTHQQISYNFGDRKASITFTPTLAGVETQVNFDAETTHSIDQQKEGWQAILNNFKRYVEAIVKQSD